MNYKRNTVAILVFTIEIDTLFCIEPRSAVTRAVRVQVNWLLERASHTCETQTTLHPGASSHSYEFKENFFTIAGKNYRLELKFQVKVVRFTRNIQLTMNDLLMHIGKATDMDSTQVSTCGFQLSDGTKCDFATRTQYYLCVHREQNDHKIWRQKKTTKRHKREIKTKLVCRSNVKHDFVRDTFSYVWNTLQCCVFQWNT